MYNHKRAASDHVTVGTPAPTMVQMMDRLTAFCKEHGLTHIEPMGGAKESLNQRTVDIKGRPTMLFEVGALQSTMKTGDGPPIAIGSLATLETELLKALQAPFKLNMTQMIATIVAFFKENGIDYTPPKRLILAQQEL